MSTPSPSFRSLWLCHLHAQVSGMSLLTLQDVPPFSSPSSLPLSSRKTGMGQIRGLCLVLRMDVRQGSRQSMDRRTGRPAVILRRGLFRGKGFSPKLISSPRLYQSWQIVALSSCQKAVSTLAICFKAMVQLGGKYSHCLHLPCVVSVLRGVLVHTK